MSKHKSMNSSGNIGTERLIQNLHNQLDRLVEQLQDIENSRDEIDTEEYNESKSDTIDQLKELNESLNKLINGDISLLNSLGIMRLATQAAISEAFKTPEVLKLFAKREPKQLRERLNNMEQNMKSNRLDSGRYYRQKAEILTALRQLGEQLTAQELQFLEKHTISDAYKMEFIEVQQDDI